MRRLFLVFVLSLFLPLLGMAQSDEWQCYKSAFDAAYEACPDVPRGLLEAISCTNTHCHHLTDDNYFHEGPDAMPRAYGLMGLVKDGKGYFRENLHLVSEISGISEAEILESPEANVKAYAMAFSCLAKESKVSGIKGYLSIIQQLSELPIGEEKDVFPMQTMLYSVCLFLNDVEKAKHFGFQPYDINFKAVFAEHYDKLQAPELNYSRDSDYPRAIWDPAPECNFGERTSPVSGVVIHYTEGSYAGCISWFKNCDASVSAHYVIRSSDGQVTQMVRESDKAWHARTANPYTIGIEHEAYGDIASFFTEAMYQSSADLVRNICSRYESIDGHRAFYRDTLDNGQCLNSGLHDLGGENACVKIRGHQHYPDQSHTDPGPFWDWNYYYKLINEGTPVTEVTGESGRIDNLSYGDDERKIWVIRCPEGSIASIDFKSFQLEKDFDFLWIYDGDNVYAPKIGRWNTKSPGKVVASSNTMCLEFRSDCSTNALGWQAVWLAEAAVGPDPTQALVGVFPNPTTGKFTVSTEREGLTDVVVSDLYGNQVVPLIRFQKSVEIDASNWASGVYFVNYGAPNQMDKVVKIVKL